MKKGRPCKLTPELQALLVKLIEDGNYIDVSCKAVGIGKTTFYSWMKKGKEDDCDEIFSEFRNAIKKAEAKTEAKYLHLIKSHSEKDWKAAAWFLERRYPQKWGRNRNINIDIESFENHPVENKGLTSSEEEALNAVLFRDDD